MLLKGSKLFFIIEGIITVVLFLGFIFFEYPLIRNFLKSYYISNNRLFLLIILHFSLVIINIYYLIRMYSQFKEKVIFPINKITNILQKFSLGNFERTVHYPWSNEVGDLSNAVNLIGKRFRELFEEHSFLKENFYEVINSIDEGILLLYNGTKIFYVNKKASEFLSVSQENIKGKNLLSILRNYELIKEVECALNSGEIKEVNLNFIRKEGSYKVIIIPVKENQRVLSCILLIKDLTFIKGLEKIKTDLIANISHELKTPITSIKGFTETLLEGAYKNEELALKFLNIIDFEVGRLYRLIIDLLNLAEIEAGKLKIKKEKVSLKDVFEELGFLFKKRFEEKKLKFYYKSSVEEIFTDKDKFMQILLNLIDNAVKYTPEGGSVWIEAENKEGEVLIKVCDTGIGIPEEDIPRIFERFYRVDKARTRESGGTGIGLAIVKHLLEALGAEIKVESELNRGSKFIISFKNSSQIINNQ
ncbi:MAG: ATP-binding protein [Thermovenabulum sp.]|uniref:sensor histidine kinase n=1 Tax=Thermovenabulum sp. TaxID=3100335 RepID=UPI003C7989B5